MHFVWPVLTPSLFTREPSNPVVQPGLYPWRRAVTFNPAVLYENGKFWMFERAAGQLRPFICAIGGLVSDDGVHFRHWQDQPVFTPEMCGSKHGSVQDPRIVKLEGRYWMTFAYRPYAWSSHPTAIGVPQSFETEFPGVARAPVDNARNAKTITGGRADNLTRSGIAVSDDLKTWKLHSWVSPDTHDERNLILFPEKVNGRYWILRRPLFAGTVGSHIWISHSPDMATWSEPVELARGMFPWETNRIGGSTPPIRTPHGWLVFYHGVEDADTSCQSVIYRMGAMMVALDDPQRVIARCPHPLLEPETYYERVGAYIPNVVFPTGAVVRDGILHLYYGVCDTAIALATARLDDVVAEVLKHPVSGG